MNNQTIYHYELHIPGDTHIVRAMSLPIVGDHVAVAGHEWRVSRVVHEVRYPNNPFRPQRYPQLRAFVHVYAELP